MGYMATSLAFNQVIEIPRLVASPAYAVAATSLGTTIFGLSLFLTTFLDCHCSWMGRRAASECAMTFSLRKEVIQPQVLLRLPCYDFTPIMSCTLDGCLLAVSTPASSTAHFRDVTGGVYKARERIHRGVLIRDY